VISPTACAGRPDNAPPGRRPTDLRLVRVFLLLLSALLLGYMFLGRGFAHLGRSPIYVGEVVLFIGLVATAVAFVRFRLRLQLSPVVWFVLGFMVLGASRTLPYLGTYGADALRDGVLWGYAFFALMIYVLADRAVVLGSLRLYGWVIPVFALWLPIAYGVFAVVSAGIQADELGSNVPIVFFKSGDMAVHIVGSLAFLVLGTRAITNLRTLAWRSAISLPLLWTVLVVGATNRGGLITVVVGVAAIAAIAFLLRRSRNLVPILIAPVALAIVLGAAGIFSQWNTGAPALTPQPNAGASASTTATPPGESPGVAGSSCDPAPASGSLVANPGFELGTLNTGTIEGWAPWAGIYNVMGGGGYRGANYALVQNTGEPWAASITSTRFPFQAGRAIAASMWAKAIDGRPIVATFVNWYDSANALIVSVLMTTTPTDGRATWQESKGSLTAPEGTVTADVQIFEAAGNAAIGIDDVIVQEAATSCDPDPASRSLVANPGFELGTLNNSSVEGWGTWAGLYHIDGGGGYRGTNYASMENTGRSQGQAPSVLTSTMFPFQAGQDISVSLWAKAINDSPVIVTYVNWYDNTDTPISGIFLNSLATDGRSTWQESTGALTAPPGTTRANVQLIVAAGKATIGIDEVIVKSGDFVVPAGRNGRSITIDQIIENITSIFSSSSDGGLEGSKAFRLRWWGTIINYTVFGDYFWTGKGFGVNLADADGFQVNLDDSLRSPHNSHITALARMGVPGFVLWLLLQSAFGIGLLRSLLRHHRAGDASLAAVGAWILAYWIAMMVNTSFDPYLEGPQGGIWFWSLFGLGLVVIHLTPRRRTA
jgi:hypothetical protein